MEDKITSQNGKNAVKKAIIALLAIGFVIAAFFLVHKLQSDPDVTITDTIKVYDPIFDTYIEKPNPDSKGSVNVAVVVTHIFSSLLVFGMFALVSGLIYLCWWYYQKQTTAYSTLAMPQYNKFLSEYTQNNSSPDEVIEAKLFARALEYITLKSPATAVFSDLNEMGIRLTTKGYEISGYVDAQNSYGAVIRTPFKFNVRKESGSWKVNTTFIAQTSGKLATNLIVSWIIASVLTLLSMGVVYFVMFG